MSTNLKVKSVPVPGVIYDSQSQPLEIGDVCVSGLPGGRYGDINYRTLVITGCTDKMVRCMHAPQQGQTIEQVVQDHVHRNRNEARKKGWIIAPWNLYKIGSIVISQAEIDDLIKYAEKVAIGRAPPLPRYNGTLYKPVSAAPGQSSFITTQQATMAAAQAAPSAPLVIAGPINLRDAP